MSTYTLPLYGWSICMVVGSVVTVCNILLIRREFMHKRTPEPVTFKPLRLFSLLCICSGACSSAIWSIHFLPGFCYIGNQLYIICSLVQVISMGYWQLSRLYQCFSKESSHTNLGYPKCLFICMYFIGGTCTLFLFCIVWFLWIDNCYIDDNYMYQEHRGNVLSSSQSFVLTIFGGILATILLFWDWITLTLYIVKLKKFMKLNTDSIAENVKHRVKEILKRIIICTCLYESMFFLMIISRTLQVFIKMDYIFIPLGQLLPSLIILSFSYSMYLMQEHNTDQYYYFLQKTQLFLCCCMKKRLYESELAESSNMEKQKEPSTPTKTTTYSTNDLSQNHGRISAVEVTMDSTHIVYE